MERGVQKSGLRATDECLRTFHYVKGHDSRALELRPRLCPWSFRGSSGRTSILFVAPASAGHKLKL